VPPHQKLALADAPASGAPSRLPLFSRRREYLGATAAISGTVLLKPSLLCRRERVVSPAENEAFDWRRTRAVGCLWTLAVGALALYPALAVAEAAPNPTSKLLPWIPVALMSTSAAGYLILVRRGVTLSTYRVSNDAQGWRVRYSFRGFLFKVRRERLFTTRTAAESFLQN
jgi:hypothetical protein